MDLTHSHLPPILLPAADMWFHFLRSRKKFDLSVSKLNLTSKGDQKKSPFWTVSLIPDINEDVQRSNRIIFDLFFFSLFRMKSEGGSCPNLDLDFSKVKENHLFFISWLGIIKF